jgi:mRNA interferase MazF
VTFDFGDVVVVPFPFTDRPIVKRRPALVLSNRAFNAANGNGIFAMITTGAGSRWPSDIDITDIAVAGLRHRSVVRWKVFTVPSDIVLAKVGALSSRDRSGVVEAARGVLPG